MIRPRTALLSTLAVATLTTLSACSGDLSTTNAENDTSTIVASTSVWGDLASGVTEGTGVEVTSIITGNVTDPHHFSPSAADMARAHGASFVVAGGGGYDAWLYEGLDDSQVIHALPLTAHTHDHGANEQSGHSEHSENSGHSTNETPITNEHIWFDLDSLSEVAQKIADRVPGADATATTEELARLKERLAALPQARVAQTEPIADYLIEDSPLEEVTPRGYRHATLAESEPAAADLAEFLELINSGEIDALVYNPQTATDMTKRIRQAAKDKGIAIVEVYETPAEGQDTINFLTQAINNFELI
ncbi:MULTISPECIES: metal ABC transporter solute-binding protein, Zn/Mn family [unclassified Corynebacterium]|uniref:metal ABC transporter solute-binding protein, Zn/Mn family n=1 Tax=unclassified Corynebacterium TaxID=2624378 RepID=UPI0029CA6745|nr:MULTISPECIES: zinc ABC transporter substrate-binding protein [unclassified Corynebacterium]WPF65830.1 zinc ABC transporter substrate-binding protein [Corynebacterium sp. 22KM0430]WPF68323.1 zinc ABC transporter substrate-binding protein [Corynebacterium sp. 21KM1197]